MLIPNTQINRASPSAIGIDGWNDDSASAWTYVSASTFTVAGDRTAVFSPGTYLKWTQTTVKYGVVASSSFGGGNTTVTIIVNTNYVLANAGISANYFSYQQDPQGWPGSFVYVPTATGVVSTTSNNCKYSVIGRIVFVQYDVGGTSDATTFTFTMPCAAKATAGLAFGQCLTVNGGSITTTPGRTQCGPGDTSFTVGKDLSNNAWQNSGAKEAIGEIFYEI